MAGAEVAFEFFGFGENCGCGAEGAFAPGFRAASEVADLRYFAMLDQCVVEWVEERFHKNI